MQQTAVLSTHPLEVVFSTTSGGPQSTAVQGDSGGHNSDSAEEVAWVPERQAHPSHLPPSPMAAAVGPECAAAVNLLCMSVQQNAPQQGQTERPAEPVGQHRMSSGNAARDSHKVGCAS